MARNPYYQGPPSDHYDGLRFFPPGGAHDSALLDILRWKWRTRGLPGWPKPTPAPSDRPPTRVASLRASFVGHSTFLIQIEGANILVDPVWSPCAGPFGRLGPRRHAPPGVAFDDLPPLDAVLVSHNHYDHLDLPTLGRLARERPCPIVTPLGNDAIIRSVAPKAEFRALDWGRSTQIGALTIHVEPALHWSARGRSDRRMALWGSFVIEGARQRVFFAGDTGYGDGSIFRDIRARRGAPTLALLPIGAYDPPFIMQNQHANPDEAVAIFGLLEADHAVACHWGTFRLTDEPYDEPVVKLLAALNRAGVDPKRFVAGPPGLVFEPPSV